MALFFEIWMFCLGAVIGSFLNVVALRFLREESLLPGSYCYHCKAKIKPYDNIPILGWLKLKGKCRSCKGPISVQYPLVELGTALLFMLTAQHFGLTWQTAFLCFLTANFMVILITDFREQAIFDINSLGLIPAGLIYAGLNFHHHPGHFMMSIGPWTWPIPLSLVSALAAIVLSAVIFGVLNLISRILVGKEGFGEGDTRLLMGIGAFFGAKWLLLTFLLSFIIQAIIGIPILLFQWIRQKAYQTTGLMACGLLFAVVPYWIQPYLQHQITWLLMITLIFSGLALYSAFKALRLAKDLPIGLTYLPFGPAIIAACLLILFIKG